MQVQEINIPDVINDNERLYLSLLYGTIESIDELSTVEVVKSSTSLHFRVAPSIPLYTEPVLEEVLKFNNKLGIKLILSKSIKSTSTLAFDIVLV